MAASPPVRAVESVVMLNPYPLVEGGRYPIKRIENEILDVEIDLFKDGHDTLSAAVLWKKSGARVLQQAPLRQGENDRWSGALSFSETGLWEYIFVAWPNAYLTWRKAMRAKWDAQTDDLASETREGAVILDKHADLAERAKALGVAEKLRAAAVMLRMKPYTELEALVFSDDIAALVNQFPDRELATYWPKAIPVRVERERARFSAWYEFFPRNAEGRSDKHSTFRDCVERLCYAKDMGFDTVYFPPIHPIGVTHRKGKNNALVAEPGDVGSPWAIGGKEGGHKAIHPALGSVEDFRWLVKQASVMGLEIALDIAFQCSPDHPYVYEHPSWFVHREDGTIRYAENPPKKYQDIYPIHFHGPDRQALWEELVDVVLFWMDKGVRVFRVDNPHTKPVSFWEFLIAKAFEKDPGVIFLAEAFTRPKMMGALGKVGFSQSYSYFTWRETKQELMDYVTELTKGDFRHFYRANFWPNTPDILPKHLQHARASSFRIRAALAAFLMPSWGIYSGYEFCENDPFPGKEENHHNEKYQLVDRDYRRPGLRAFIRELNRLRQGHAAFHLYENVEFVSCDNDKVLAFVRSDKAESILVVINLDPDHPQAATVRFDPGVYGIREGVPYHAHDLMHGEYYPWHGGENYVELHPDGKFMHALRLEPI